MPPGISITPEEFDAISEWDIFDYIGEREKEIPDDMPELKAACKLLHVNQFKYLLPIGVLMHWNLFGGVSNISYGTAPQASVNEYAKRVVVVNHNVAKRCTLSNVFGDQKKLVEGGKIGLVVRRKVGILIYPPPPNMCYLTSPQRGTLMVPQEHPRLCRGLNWMPSHLPCAVAAIGMSWAVIRRATSCPLERATNLTPRSCPNATAETPLETMESLRPWPTMHTARCRGLWFSGDSERKGNTEMKAFDFM